MLILVKSARLILPRKFMKIVVVVPTYNEKNNILTLISCLREEFVRLSNHEWQLLVVDDHSPDGTGQLVRNAMGTYPFIHLSEGEKTGLGAAYARGFDYAINNLSADLVFEMDADLSHDPHYLGPMVEAIEQGADVALGSRYIFGGALPPNWGIDRQLFSVLGNIVARAVLWVWSVRDFTSGFRATRVKGFLDQIDFSKLLSKQYAYKIHLLYSLHELGAVIKEVPIVFVDRERGYSKMPTNNILDSLRVVFTLRYRQLEQFIKVCAVGTLGFVIQTVVYALLLKFSSIASFNAAVLGAEAAILVMFPVNNWWSFRNSAVGGSSYFKKLFQFNLVAFGSMAIQWLVIYLANGFFGSGWISNGLFYIIGILLGLIWNFTMYKKVVWRV